MAGYIEDRWLNKRPDPTTGKRKRTDRYGKGKRYKVAGIPGVRDRAFDTLADAKAWKAKAEHESRAGDFYDPRKGTITLREYAEQHWRPGKHGAPKTLKNIDDHLAHLLRELGAVQLHALTPQRLRAAIANLLAVPLAGSYVGRMMSTLSSVLEVAVDDKRIPRNPMRSRSVVIPADSKEKREAWPLERVAHMREAISARYRLVLVLGVGCGLRKGEALGLSADDVDFAAGVIHVRRQVQSESARRYFRLPKGNKTRVVDMPPTVAVAIREHMAQWPPCMVELPWATKHATDRQKHPLLITTKVGTAVCHGKFDTNIWKPALVRAGVIPPKPKGAKAWQYEASPKDGFHVLRHTYASLQLEAGESVVTLAQWLGHESPNITLEHYAHFMPQAGAKGRAAVDKLLGERPAAETPHRLPKRPRLRSNKVKMQVRRAR
ncbi:tyrosine-type recombinase/integrase [Streptomyces sp. B8F3]|uniref:tyrosine-type recombinase/integrase n=1 Tax=Streptomyces sp. B8F3 TaxID=3153573 RepID=UPI00325C6AF7